MFQGTPTLVGAETHWHLPTGETLQCSTKGIRAVSSTGISSPWSQSPEEALKALKSLLQQKRRPIPCELREARALRREKQERENALRDLAKSSRREEKEWDLAGGFRGGV